MSQSPLGMWVGSPSGTGALENPNLDDATEQATSYIFTLKTVYRRTFTGVTPSAGASAALTAAAYAQSFANPIGGYLFAGGTRMFSWAHTMLNGVVERCWIEIDPTGAFVIFVGGTFYQLAPYKAIIYYTKP